MVLIRVPTTGHRLHQYYYFQQILLIRTVYFAPIAKTINISLCPQSVSSRLASGNGKYEEKIILFLIFTTQFGCFPITQYIYIQNHNIQLTNNKQYQFKIIEQGQHVQGYVRLITIYMLLSEDPRMNIWKVGKCMKICETCTVVYWQTIICKLCVYFFSAISSR